MMVNKKKNIFLQLLQDDEVVSMKSLMGSLGSLIVLIIFCLFYSNPQRYQNIGIIILIFFTINAFFSSPLTIFITTIVGTYLWNYLFIPPRFSLYISEISDWLILMACFIVSLIVGFLTFRLKNKEKILLLNENRLNLLYFFSSQLHKISGISSKIQFVKEKIKSELNLEASIICEENKIKIIPMNPKLSEGLRNLLNDIGNNLNESIEKEKTDQKLESLKIHEASEKLFLALLNSVSHELKTPIAVIHGASTTLLEADVAKCPKLVLDLSKEIIIAVKRMQKLVENLLDMGRIETGLLRLRKDATDIRDIIANALTEIEEKFPNKQINVIYPEKKHPIFLADSKLIEQVIYNIIYNSCLYTPLECNVLIKIEIDEEKIKIKIIDNGPGLPKDDPNIVFDKFYRKDANATGGSGIGLTISKAIIELHDGTIMASNNQPSGACFLIQLPLGGVLYNELA